MSSPSNITANDNIHTGKETDISNGFNRLLGNLRTQLAQGGKPQQTQTPIDQTTLDQDTLKRGAGDEQSPSLISTAVNFIGLALLFILMGLSAWLISLSVDPIGKLAGYCGLFIGGITGAGLADVKKLWHVKSLAILTALGAGGFFIYTLGTSFDVSWLSVSKNGFWFASAMLALAGAYIFKSRIALILSVITLLVWGYMLVSANISLTNSSLLMAVTAGLQAFVASRNKDKLLTFISGVLAFGGAIAAALFIQQTKLVTLPFIISALLMVGGIFYIATAHPVKVWFTDKQRSTSLIAWAALMTGCIITAWMWLYASLDVSEAPTPLNDFIWQLTLICGAGLLFACVFIRQPKTAHSLPRRFFAALSIMCLALTHYFQHDIAALIQQFDIISLPYFAAIALLGIIATLTLNRFLASMTYSHHTGIAMTLFVTLMIGASMSILFDINKSSIGLFAICAILTAWFLSMTQNKLSARAKPAKQNKRGKEKTEAIARDDAASLPSLQQA